MKRVEFIFYVADQERAAGFYQAVLGMEPTLNVPGMTEFELGDSVVLGIMLASGIVSLLGNAIADPLSAAHAPRAELYLSVENPVEMVQRALDHGAKLLSPVTRRNWGDDAGYIADLDGHVIAFAYTFNQAS